MLKNILGFIFITHLFVAQILTYENWYFYKNYNNSQCVYFPNGCVQKPLKLVYDSQVYNTLICERIDVSFSLDDVISIQQCDFMHLNLYFRLKRPHIIDSKLDLKMYEKISYLNRFQAMVMSFRFVKGFDIDSFQINTQLFFDLLVYDSNFAFYSNGSRIKSCEKISHSVFSIFQSTPRLAISATFVRTRFKHEICPLVFRNSNICYLEFSPIIDTYYKTNVLRFTPGWTAFTNDSDLNTGIVGLNLKNIFNVQIDDTLLDPYVFKNLKVLFLDGYVRFISHEMFVLLRKIKKLHLNSVYYKRLAHKGIAWVHGLNCDLESSSDDTSQMYNASNSNDFVFVNVYVTVSPEYSQKNQDFNLKTMFPDEDFCIYKDFPFNKSIVFLKHIVFEERIATCTYAWLIQYSASLGINATPYGENDELQYLSDFHDLNKTIIECDFAERFKFFRF